MCETYSVFLNDNLFDVHNSWERRKQTLKTTTASFVGLESECHGLCLVLKDKVSHYCFVPIWTYDQLEPKATEVAQ